MFSILAGLKRPTARLATALGISITLIGASLQLPISSADSVARPLRVDVTQQITSAGDDVNEDGSSFDADYEFIWLGTGANPSASYTGLRFTNLAVPQGATITSAKLQVFLSSSSWSSLSFDYFAENSGNSAAFSTSNRPSQRTLTSQSASHSSDVNWPANTWIDLDEISTVVQPVISRGDWTSGNALSIILKGVGGAWGRKYVTAYDGSATYAIRLAITYTTSGPTPTNTVVAPTNTPTATRTNTPVGPTATAVGGGTQLSRQVVGSSDDVNEDGTGFETDYGTVWFGTGANPSASYTGLRFTNITIPQGATITSAKLQVYLSNSSWNQLSFDYFAENTGSSATFSASSRPSQRALTSQSVSHSSDVNWPGSTWIDLDEISSVVQPVISRSDWTSGNALSIILKGVGGAYGRKFVTAYDGTPANAVRLAIVYSVSAATATRTSTASATATRTVTATASPTSTQVPTQANTPTPTMSATLVPPTLEGGYPGPTNEPGWPASQGFRVLLPALSRWIAPPATVSRYTVVNYTLQQNYQNVLPAFDSTQMYVLGQRRGGCGDNSQTPPQRYDNIVLLQLGSPWRNISNQQGAIIYGSYETLTTTQIEAIIRSFILGYRDCIGNSPVKKLTLAVGLNNSGSQVYVTSDHGRAWALMINSLDSYARSIGLSLEKLRVAGGMDFESEFGDAASARNWLVGYGSVGVNNNINFGTCNGCATDGSVVNGDQGIGGAPPGFPAWTYNDYWFLSYGAVLAWVMPEIYSTDGTQAKQWYTLSKFAATCGSPCWPATSVRRGPIDFPGALSQYQACLDHDANTTSGDECAASMRNKPSEAWRWLVAMLVSDPITKQDPYFINFATDMSYTK